MSAARPSRVRTRAVLAGATAAALVVAVVGPARAQEPEGGTGTTVLSFIPAELSVQGLPTPIEARLGDLVAEATNVGGGLASLALEGLSAAGQEGPGFTASSAEGDKSGTETRQAGAAGIGAVLELLDYAVSSDASSATSRLGALGGELTTPLGLGTTLDAQELLAAVTADGADGGMALNLSGVELGLGDLLPEDLLDALPLSALTDLVERLGLPLPADLASGLADLEDLPSTLTEAVEAARDLGGLQTQLEGLLAGLPDLAGAQQAVTDAQARVDQLTSQLSGLTSQIQTLTGQIDALTAERSLLSPILDLLRINELTAQIQTLTSQRTSLQGQITTLTSQLTSAEGVLSAAEGALATLVEQVSAINPQLGALLDQVTDLEGLLGGLLGQLTGLLDGLDLPDLRSGLLDELAGSALLDLGDLGIDLSTAADGSGSEGIATCTASGVEILGTPVPTPTCADIAGAIDQLGGALTDALGALPLAGGLPTVDVGGLEVTSSGAREAADGISEAFARVSALTLAVAPAELTAITDDLVGQLDGLAGELTGLLGGLDLGLLEGLPGLAGARTADAGVSGAALALPAGLDTALGELQGALDLLPVGDALDGLSTLGLDAVLGAVDVTSTFAAAGAPTAPPTPATPGSPSAPGAPTAPGTPGTPGQLPRTGTDVHLLVMAALAALAAGATAVGVGRAAARGLHTSHRRPAGS